MSTFPLDTIRHSSAHLMAQAISRVFPNEQIQFGVGPVIEHGFYYDVDMKHRLTDDDLKSIEQEMKSIIKESLPIERKVLSKPEALKFFKEQGQELKIELIKDFDPQEEITCYSQGEFIDLCRGPHVETTRDLPPNFKLLSVAGAYWRGDEKRPMLQRVYAACFKDRKELKQHLNFLEEAKKRDHRKLGKELDLFSFDPVAPASPFFSPKGTFVYNELIDFMRRIYKKFDYDEVITPQILDSDLWQTSGHYDHYKDNMYFSHIDDREFAIKPMNCPCHMLMFKHKKYSYRDLPLRYADFGRLHRYEKAGAVAGLTRVRTFCQDDAHIFLPLEKVQAEIIDLMKMFFVCYEHFGFNNIKVGLSTRPEDKAGDDKTWDIAEKALEEALKSENIEYFVNEGDGAFYGPKIDVQISDAIGRYHQLGTIQLDFQLPQRFDLNYTQADGESQRPVVIHRALLGSLERFFGVYLEHVAGVFPFWLAPTQLTIVPVNNEHHLDFSKKLLEELKKLGFRATLDERNESLGYKTRQIQKSKTPFMMVIGDKEIETGNFNIRKYGEKHSHTMSKTELLEILNNLQEERVPKELR